MKTVLIYVIGCNSHPYPLIIDASLKTWDCGHVDGVETLYYFGRGKIPQHPKMIQFPVEDDLWRMGQKDLVAFKWALNNRQWDYMARPNVPTYVNKVRLLNQVQELPERRVFRGVCAPYESRKYLWGGLQFIISRDVVEDIVRNGHRWNHGLIEDVAISMLVQELGYSLDCNGHGTSINKKGNGWLLIWYEEGKQGGFDFTDFRDLHQFKQQYFYRTKQDHIHRDIDIQIMDSMYRAYL